MKNNSANLILEMRQYNAIRRIARRGHSHMLEALMPMSRFSDVAPDINTVEREVAGQIARRYNHDHILAVAQLLRVEWRKEDGIC